MTESDPVLAQQKDPSSMRKTRRSLAAGGLIVSGLLAGCGGGGDTTADQTPTPTMEASESPSGTPTNTPTQQEGTVIDATIRGDDIEPNGQRLQVEVGEAITINVDADRAGELHVHSSPEQELEYAKGRTTLHLSIDTPGIVEVEDHVADKVLVSLEVS